MYRLTAFVIASALLAGAVLAAAPSEETVQGLYEGACKDGKVEARVVAMGKGTFKVFVRPMAAEAKGCRAELDGKTDGDAVKFTGLAPNTDWALEYADGAIKGACGKDCTMELKRVVREPPTLGAKPPEGAIVLLDGKNFDEVTKQKNKDGTDQEWMMKEGGAIQVPKGGMNSKRAFDGNYKLHVEFWLPVMPNDRGQGRSNSGCFQANGDEIQVLDSFGMPTYEGGGCAGIYHYKDPDCMEVIESLKDQKENKFTLASLPPGQWQTYDVEYKVEKKDGKPTGKPKVTVFHNGIKIHDNFEMHNDAKAGTLHFQDHGNAVQFRNIWVLPLPDK